MTAFVSTRPVTPCAARPSLGRIVTRALALHRSRRALADLTPEQLQDIGLTSKDAATEAARPIWDAPAQWLCETR